MVVEVERPMPIKCLRWQSVVSGSPSPTPDLHAVRNQHEKGRKARNNQCSGSDELDSVASSYPRRRKISGLKTRADRAL